MWWPASLAGAPTTVKQFRQGTSIFGNRSRGQLPMQSAMKSLVLLTGFWRLMYA